MKKVILVDDHKIFRQGLKSLIVQESLAEVVGEAQNGLECLEMLKKSVPDLVLMDIQMPMMNGLETTRQALYPDIKVLILSSFGDETFYYDIVHAGAKGFVLKTAGINELKDAICEVAEGGNFFSPELLRKVIANINNNIVSKENLGSKKDSLTKRELEILQLVASGNSNEEISEKLNISITTVKGHRSNLLIKTGSKNSAGLTMYAIRNKIISI